MTTYNYDIDLAVDARGVPQASVAFDLYDTPGGTIQAITDQGGTPLSRIVSNTFGVTPRFKASISRGYLSAGILFIPILSLEAQDGAASAAVAASALAVASTAIQSAGVDATMAAAVATPGTATAGALTAAYAGTRQGSSAAQSTIKKLRRDAENVVIAVMGDSTGQTQTPVPSGAKRWPRLLCETLAPQWPTHTFIYHEWTEVDNAYNGSVYPDVIVQTGTGTGNAGAPFVVDLYNGSISGSIPPCPLMAGTGGVGRYRPILTDLQPDLILGSYGHNMPTVTDLMLADLWEQVALDCPDSAIILMSQNPAQTDGKQALRSTAIESFAEQRGFGFIDIHQIWVDAGNPAGWYVDMIHPALAGSTVWAAEVLAHLQYNKSVQPVPRQPSSLATTVEPMLANCDFSDTAGNTAIPRSWALAGGATWANDFTHYESTYNTGFSRKLVAGVANAQQYCQQGIGLPPEMRGKWITVGVRMMVPVGGSDTAGGISLNDGATSVSRGAWGPTRQQGAWHWVVLTLRTGPTATQLTLNIYAEGVNNNPSTSGYILIDRVQMCRGQRLHDIPPRRQSTFQDDLVLKIGKKWLHYEASNDTQGKATLVAGTVTVATTAVKSSDRIRLTPLASGATANWGSVAYGTITNSASFVITSSNPADTRAVWWELVGVA